MRAGFSRDPGVTQQAQAAGVMKSKTSESLVASESKGVKKDGVDEVKQKQLKKGENRMRETAMKRRNLEAAGGFRLRLPSQRMVGVFFRFCFFQLHAGRYLSETADDNTQR